MTIIRTRILVFLALISPVMTLTVHAGVTHKQLNELNSVTYVEDDAWQPRGFVNGISVPAIHLAAVEITMDGMELEPEWQRAPEVTVPLSYGTTPEVHIKAMYTEKEVFLRVRWPDASQDRDHRPWKWDVDLEQYVESPAVEDSVLISFEAGCEWTPSLLGGYMYDFDAWHWLAARSDPLGQAVDLYGNVQNEEKPISHFYGYDSRVTDDSWVLKFTENHDVDLHADWDELDRVYMMQPVSPAMWVRAVPDGGHYFPPFYEQKPAPTSKPDAPEAVVPQYSPLELTGSAAEVKAKGHWEDGYWTVEFRRDRFTPVEHIYDTIFNRTIQFSIHVFDQTERLDEVAESPRLFLRFLPEEEPLLVKE